ncbi:hypothetical protein BGX31_009527 [Mortierella sp. GBA43]|nr:hypothetical protein BGX31_009527 [Mortierella sp. GBA43]
MRYMVERGFYLADLLNRTLVLPNHLRIRRCSDEAICARTAIPLDLNAIGRNEQGSTMALDLGYFFDLPHLSEKTHGRIIDFRTFMERVVGVPRDATLVDSQFGAQVSFWKDQLRQQRHGQPLDVIDGYRATDDDEGFMIPRDLTNHPGQQSGQEENQEVDYVSMHRVNRAQWDLEDHDDLSIIDNLIRNGLVDSFEDPSPEERENAFKDEHGTFKVRRSFYAFSDVRGGGLDRIVEWSLDFKHDSRDHVKAVPVLDSDSCHPPSEDSNAKNAPWEARFPAFATCRIEHYVGLKQELGQVTAPILSIEGQFHTAGWIPIIYSSIQNAQKHRIMATSFLRYSPAVYEAAKYLMERLESMLRAGRNMDVNKNNGDVLPSSWFLLSMHVRRGDFIDDKHGWQKFDDAWMGSLIKEAVESVFSPDHNSTSASHGPRFYIATDESSPEVIDYFHSVGALLFEDLIDEWFEERFRHLVVYDDWIGLVEQLICAQAKQFYGTMTSSFTSGIVNMRLSMDQKEDTHGHRGFAYFIKNDGPLLTTEQEKLGA